MRCLKRPFDICLAVAMLIFFSPVMLAIFCLVRQRLGHPAIFRQERLGKGDRRFVLYKFRSMTDARSATGELLPDAERLSTFGKLLRSTSLDELPQLWNILRGDMSFIGPRATLLAYEPFIREKYPVRFAVRPGLTSLAGIRGRNALSQENKYAADVEYVENCGFFMDMKILFSTIPVVVSRRGVEHGD